MKDENGNIGFIMKLMNNRPKVKYSSLNDNSIAFDGHRLLKDNWQKWLENATFMKHPPRRTVFANLGVLLNQSRLKIAYVAHFLTALELNATSEAFGYSFHQRCWALLKSERS
jgi:hypothetical protein